MGIDPVDLRVMWDRLIHVTEECWATIWRTAFSTIIGEAQDFGVELLDADGRSLAHSPRSMPVFNLPLPRAVAALMARFPRESLQEGDVLVTNDPWVCAGHLFDVAAVTPVFRRGTLVGIVGSIAHCSDIGGSKDSARVREVYEEGLQIPPMRLYRAGECNRDLFDLIAANVRQPATVIGDIQAQVAANLVGARRLLEFMDEYGLSDLGPLAREIQDRSEAAMRAAIAALPDGVHVGAATCDGVAARLTLPVAVRVAGDALTVSFAGAPPEEPRGGVNCTYSYTAAHAAYALKCLLAPDLPSSHGAFRPITVEAPEGSVLACRRPASVGVRTRVGWYIATAIFQALADAMPDRVKAHTASPLSVTAYGDGFNDHMLLGGGNGAWRGGDGQSALLFPTSAANVAVEMFEARTPVLVEKKALVAGSGGAGRWRGGLGQEVVLRKLWDDGAPVLVAAHVEGARVDVPGLFGGAPGARAGGWVARGGGPLEAAAVGDPAPEGAVGGAGRHSAPGHATGGGGGESAPAGSTTGPAGGQALPHAAAGEGNAGGGAPAREAAWEPIPPGGAVVLTRADERVILRVGGGSGYGQPPG